MRANEIICSITKDLAIKSEHKKLDFVVYNVLRM